MNDELKQPQEQPTAGSACSAGLDRANVRTWNQEGFAIIAQSPILEGLPVVEGFYLPKWEAENHLRQVRRQMTEAHIEMQMDFQIVPATLTFRLSIPTERAAQRKQLTGPTGDRMMNEDEKSQTRDIEIARAGWVRVERRVRCIWLPCL